MPTGQPNVLFEDNHLLILDKPSGWLIQSDQTGDISLTDWAREYIKKKYNKPGDVFLHPAHRLDRPVSGVVIFAWTSKALERMAKMFRENAVEKIYVAMVKDRLDAEKGKLIHWLEKGSDKNVTKAYNKPKGKAKQAELDYQLLGAVSRLSLVQVQPKTGRPHQIRVQLSKMGNPIKGDLKYGYPEPNPDKSISLHAFKIRFEHPVKKEMVEVTSVPDWNEFSQLLHELA